MRDSTDGKDDEALILQRRAQPDAWACMIPTYVQACSSELSVDSIVLWCFPENLELQNLLGIIRLKTFGASLTFAPWVFQSLYKPLIPRCILIPGICILALASLTAP